MITINAEKNCQNLHLHAENADELQIGLNAFYNWSITDDTRDVSEGQTAASVRSSRRRLIHGLCEAKRVELRDTLGRSPSMAKVCVQVAHFIHDTFNFQG